MSLNTPANGGQLMAYIPFARSQMRSSALNLVLQEAAGVKQADDVIGNFNRG